MDNGVHTLELVPGDRFYFDFQDHICFFTLEERTFQSGKGGGWGWLIEFDKPPPGDPDRTDFFLPTRTWLKRYGKPLKFNNRKFEMEVSVWPAT